MGAAWCVVMGGAIVGPSRQLLCHVAPMQTYTNAPLNFLLRRLSRSAVLWTEMEKTADLLECDDLALARRLTAGRESDPPPVLQAREPVCARVVCVALCVCVSVCVCVCLCPMARSRETRVALCFFTSSDRR